ncbi:YqaA family protein [Minwuia sp.]|uniref:YqaA family protein n=1 Tax=Minwuia sp. TaxID=2493630 RepID=UPI003A9301C5
MSDRNDADPPRVDEQRSSRVRRWTERLRNSRRALWILFVASFAETIIVPIPIELILIPFMVTNRHRLWLTAAMVTAGCLLASLVGYGIGYLFFDTVGQDIVNALGWSSHLEQFRTMFDRYGFWAIVAVGVIPIPFQIAMLAAGAAGYPVLMFVIAATIARGLRYFGLALLVYFFGARAESFWKRHKLSASLAAAVVLLAAFGTSLLL